jgi:hypothetical protein
MRMNFGLRVFVTIVYCSARLPGLTSRRHIGSGLNRGGRTQKGGLRLCGRSLHAH